MYPCAYTYISIQVLITHVYLYACVLVLTCAYIYVHACMYVCTYTCVYIYICVHCAYTHTRYLSSAMFQQPLPASSSSVTHANPQEATFLCLNPTGQVPGSSGHPCHPEPNKTIKIGQSYMLPHPACPLESPLKARPRAPCILPSAPWTQPGASPLPLEASLPLLSGELGDIFLSSALTPPLSHVTFTNRGRHSGHG